MVRIYDYVHRALWCVESVCNIPLFDLTFRFQSRHKRQEPTANSPTVQSEWSTRTDGSRRTSTKIRQAKSEALHLSLLVFTFGGTGLTSLCYTPLSCTGTSRFKFKLLLQVRPGPDFTSYNAVDRFININRQPNKYYGKPRSKVLSRLAGEVRVDGDDETQRKEHELELELELELEIRGVGSHLATSSTMLLPPA